MTRPTLPRVAADGHGAARHGAAPASRLRTRAISGVVIAVGLVLLQVAVAFATDPTPTPQTGGDPRSPGQGPGFVGQPLLAIGVVIAVAVLAVALTLAYVRLTADPPD